MVSLLTEAQRQELHNAIVGYLKAQNVDPAFLSVLSAQLAASGTDSNILERKWAALVRMQRKILDLESANAKLVSELQHARQQTVSSRRSDNASVASYLPKYPPQHTLEGHRGRIVGVSFHPKYSMLASGSEDGEVKLWDPELGELERTLKAHTRGVHGLAFAPHSGVLVTGSADLSIKIWSPQHQFANTRTLLGHDHTVSAIAIAALGSSHQEYIISASRDHTVRIWDLKTGFLNVVLRHHTDWVRAVDVTSCAQQTFQHILSCGSDRTVCLVRWGDLPAEPVKKFHGHKHVIECGKFAPPSSHRFLSPQFPQLKPEDLCFATGGRDNLIHIWCSALDEPLFTLRGHDNWVQGLAFHPLGRFLASVGDDKTMRIWDLATQKLVKTVDAHEHFVSCLAWHNKTVATGSVDQTVKVW